MTFARATSFALLATIAACTTEPVPGEICTGKCDSATQALVSLEMNNVRATDESQHFRLVGMVYEGLADTIRNGTRLSAEMWLVDGSSSDARIKAQLSFEVDGVGGFISKDIDASAFVPWRAMVVRVQGRLNGMVVDQYFGFEQGNLKGQPADENWVPSAIAKLGANQVSFDPDAPSQVLQFWAGLNSSFIAPGDAKSGDTLALALTLADGDASPNFTIPATLTYDGDTADAFVSGAVDVSAFLPWKVLKARVTGTIGGDTPVDRTFTIRIADVD